MPTPTDLPNRRQRYLRATLRASAGALALTLGLLWGWLHEACQAPPAVPSTLTTAADDSVWVEKRRLLFASPRASAVFTHAELQRWAWRAFGNSDKSSSHTPAITAQTSKSLQAWRPQRHGAAQVSLLGPTLTCTQLLHCHVLGSTLPVTLYLKGSFVRPKTWISQSLQVGQAPLPLRYAQPLVAWLMAPNSEYRRLSKLWPHLSQVYTADSKLYVER